MSEPTAPDPSRRRLLCAALGAGTAVVGASLFAPPLVVFVAPALDSASPPAGGPQWVDVGPAARFEIGASPRSVVLRTERRDAWRVESGVALGTIWVTRTAPEAFRVHSARCTHLGCAVDFREAAFVCPCHGARFSPDGALAAMPDGAANPAPRPLDALPWRLERDHLVVGWQRFALNVPEQRPEGAEGTGAGSPDGAGGAA